MGIYDVIRIFVFFLGSALQIAILFLMAKRKAQHGRELILAFLSCTVLGWTFGIFTSLFSSYLYQTDNIIKEAAGIIGIISFIFIFPLILHTLLNFATEKYLKISKFIKYLIYIFIYLISLIYTKNIWYNLTTILKKIESFKLEYFIYYFIHWIFILLICSWYITTLICKKAEDEEDIRSAGIIGGVIIGLVCSYFITFVLKASSIPIIGVYLSLGSEFLTFVVPPIIAYYIYRYNYMEYVFKRGIIYSMLGVFVIVLYISIIRPMAQTMEKEFHINFKMVEGILVMILVFFFNPLKKVLQELFNRIFFKEKQYYRKVFSDISLKINKTPYMDLESLLEEVASTISKAMNIREVSFVFFEKNKDKIILKETTLAITPRDIKNIVNYIETNKLRILNIYDLNENDKDILKEMRSIKAFTVIPIYNENTLIGLLNIGRRRIHHQLRAEEEEMLMMLVNQMVIAIENTRLIREKFLLERKIYENEKLSSLGRLSASIAHEVKNPLSSIKAIVQVMKEDLSQDDPNQEGLNLIIEEIDRLSRVVKQLLLFARPHSGNLENVNIEELIKDVIMILKHEADKRKVIIETKFEGENISMLSDKDGLCEIFFNLIHNAIQSLSEGGKVIIHKKVENSKIIIAVIDNGPGIPFENKEKIFEPFFTTKQTGTGLGLTIVKHRLEKLKGKIEVKDNNPGTIFEVILPINSLDKVKIPGELEKEYF